MSARSRILAATMPGATVADRAHEAIRRHKALPADKRAEVVLETPWVDYDLPLHTGLRIVGPGPDPLTPARQPLEPDL